MKKGGSTDKRYLRRSFNRSYYYKKGEKAEEASSGSKKVNGVASANGKGKDVDVQSEGDPWDREQEEADLDDEELFYTVLEGEAKNRKVGKMTLSGKEKELLPQNGEECNKGDNQDKNNILCPLCVEVLDETDRNFFPCDCGYQICLWCLYYIRDHMCNKCPACRRSYDEKNFIYNRETHEKLVKKQKNNHKGSKTDANNSNNNNSTNAPNGVSGSSGAGPTTGASISQSGTNNTLLHHHSGSSTAIFNKPDLYKNPNIYNIHEYENIFEIIKGIRVVQRNLVFVIGITANYAKKNILKKNEYFGKYGQILNIIVNKSQAYNPHYNGPSFSAYITYSNEKEAVNAIYFIDGMVLDNKTLKASFGTTKYCASYLKNSVCTNEDCFYLHELGNVIDSFSKDDIHGPKHIYHDLLYYYFKKHPDKRSEQSNNCHDSSGSVVIKSARKSEEANIGGVATSGGGVTGSAPPAMLSFAAAMSMNEKDLVDAKKKSDTLEEATPWKKQHSSAASVLSDGKAKSLEIISKGVEKCVEELKKDTKMKDGLTSKGSKDNYAGEEKSKWSSEGNFANLIKNAGVANTSMQEVEEEKNNAQTKSKKKKKKQKSEENIPATNQGKEDQGATVAQKEKNYKDSLQNNNASKNDNGSKNNSLEVEEDPYYVDGMSENYPLITDVHFDKDKKKKMKKKAEKKKANEKKKAEEVKMLEAKEGEAKVEEATKVVEEKMGKAKTGGTKTGKTPTEETPAEDRKANGKGGQSAADAAQKEEPSQVDFPPLREDDKDAKKQKKKQPNSGNSAVNDTNVISSVEGKPAQVEDPPADSLKEKKQIAEQPQEEKKNKYAKIALKIGSFFNYAFDGGRKTGGDEAKGKTSPSVSQKANKKVPTTVDAPSVVAAAEDVQVGSAAQLKEDPSAEGGTLSKQKKEETNVKEDKMKEKGERKKNDQSSLKKDIEKVKTDVGVGAKEKKEIVEEGTKKERGGGFTCQADKEDTPIGGGEILDDAAATAIAAPSETVSPPRTREKRDKKGAQDNNTTQEEQMKKHAQVIFSIQNSNPDVPLQAIIEDYIERRRAATKEILHFDDLHNAMNSFIDENAAKGERSNQRTGGSTAHASNVNIQEHLRNGEEDDRQGDYARTNDAEKVRAAKPEGERQSVEKTHKGVDAKSHLPCAKEKKKKDTLNKRKLHQKEMEGDITSIIREMMMQRMTSKSRRNKNGSVRETSGKSEMGQTDHRISSGEDPTEKNALFDDMEIFLKNLCVAKGKAIQSSLQSSIGSSIGSNLESSYADSDAVYFIEGNGRRKNDYLMYTSDEHISLKSHKGVMEFIIKKDQNIDVKKNKKNYLHEDTFDIYKELILSKNSDLQTANDILFEKIFNEEIDFVQQLCKENCLNGSGKICSSSYTMEKTYYDQGVNLKKKCKKKMQTSFPNLWVNFNQSLHTQEMSEKVNLSA